MTEMNVNEIAVEEMEVSQSLVEYLSPEQSGALEVKYAALAPEIQQSMASKFPTVTSPVALYILRQAIKEANGKLASTLRPTWIVSVKLNLPSLVSVNADSRKESARRLDAIADEMPDVKESIKVLKAVKIQLDMTSSDPAIIAACKIFGIQPSSLK